MEEDLNLENEFVYWAHPTPVGIKVEEVSGMTSRSGRVWIEMARQIYCEHGCEDYRDLGHYNNGAPFLFGSTQRISLAHADRLLVVATLPKTPEVTLGGYSRRAAMGIDAERLDRRQVLKVRERFLNEDELDLISPADLEGHIVAWTAKEALYKAAMTGGLDLRRDITIDRLPAIDRALNRPGVKPQLGSAGVAMPGRGREELTLYSYESEGHCVTLAFHGCCARFGG